MKYFNWIILHVIWLAIYQFKCFQFELVHYKCLLISFFSFPFFYLWINFSKWKLIEIILINVIRESVCFKKGFHLNMKEKKRKIEHEIENMLLNKLFMKFYVYHWKSIYPCEKSVWEKTIAAINWIACRKIRIYAMSIVHRSFFSSKHQSGQEIWRL